jgi:phosphonate transport system substrate-binding protein
MEHDLKAKKLDLVFLTPGDFLELAGRTPLDPVMVSVAGKSHELEILILVRKDRHIRDFKELRNSVIAVPAKVIQHGTLYSLWVETLVMREGFHDMAAFFNSVRETPSPSQALMQVFFRQADACAVTSQTFELASELNPQIGREIMALARKDKLVGGIIAVRRDLSEEHKQKVRQVLATLHEDQGGRQLLVLFQLNRLVPYRADYIKTTEAFIAEHKKLMIKLGPKHSRNRP